MDVLRLFDSVLTKIMHLDDLIWIKFNIFRAPLMNRNIEYLRRLNSYTCHVACNRIHIATAYKIRFHNFLCMIFSILRFIKVTQV